MVTLFTTISIIILIGILIVAGKIVLEIIVNIDETTMKAKKLLEYYDNKKKEEEEKERMESRDKALREYAIDKNKNLSPGEIQISHNGSSKVKSDGDLIPYGLSEGDKELLRDFYKNG